jgi:hypothetical protein
MRYLMPVLYSFYSHREPSAEDHFYTNCGTTKKLLRN